MALEAKLPQLIVIAKSNDGSGHILFGNFKRFSTCGNGTKIVCSNFSLQTHEVRIPTLYTYTTSVTYGIRGRTDLRVNDLSLFEAEVPDKTCIYRRRN
ncbi:MAG: hypothetical protein US53_C0013G0002 [Candidatus Woesebacteria bacterium GW2011_GWA1_37_7]|uniref:Uncharacterized protein n=1 Tax=Candidatus Woesebacteria bacterium GW2011_GWA1_37_7 TaxID=1618545 RepID=A0A0G0H345_9BACT|nr:MAG: hypothetical protein US53_C0013G0002 [Candidatus Woesebacteria bacterium GW2011_GWA1_37_7]